MKALWVIAGPTASGKTACAIEVAEAIGAEIVNADSQQVYQRFDIGTAKPNEGELARARHHLVSVIDPHAGFSAAEFAARADAAIADIQGRGKKVIVVGGTGLYIRALLHGMVSAPPVDRARRQVLEEEAAEKGAAVLHARLRQSDPESAERIAPSDVVRLIRALELQTLTGTPASVLRRRHRFEEDRYPYQLFVLSPPRDALYAAIEARVRTLFSRGLVEETRQLVREGFRDTPPMRSVGYRHALEVVEGRWTEERAIDEVARETRRYAKRQLTWFRRERGARWVEPPYLWPSSFVPP